MLIFLTTLLAPLRSIFRSRAALELENLALRHQNRCTSEICSKAPEIDLRRPPVVALPVPPLARLALGTGHRQTRNSPCLASCRLSLVLDLEGAARPTGTTCHFARGPRAGPQDVPGEPHLRCTPHPRRTSQTRHRRRREQSQQLYAALSQTPIANLAHIGAHRLAHGGHRVDE